MAKAGGGGGGVGAGGHGALTWVVSGAAGRRGGRGSGPRHCSPPAAPGVAGRRVPARPEEGGRTGKPGLPDARPVGAAASRTPARPFLSSLPRRRFERATRT